MSMPRSDELTEPALPAVNVPDGVVTVTPPLLLT